MGVSQAGHALGGRTIDAPLGTRQTTTLRNDPMSSPKAPHRTASRITGTY